MIRERFTATLISLGLVLALSGCMEGDDTGPSEGTGTGPAACSGDCATASSKLSPGDVERVIAQAVAEADARNAGATIAVVDRSGNVLGVFRMNNADTSVRIDSGRDPAVEGGLEQIDIIPDTLAAIAKAVTGAYLSSEGNAFTTRTASQIVQEHFNPGETGAPGGPLFGVQFSQLPCSDLNREFSAGGVSAGPHRSPLGLSADPGGLPLYKDGTPVGGVGVIADGEYGLDLDVTDTDEDLDELIATAATFGFAAPADRRANRITVEGKTFRFSDAAFDDLASDPDSAAGFASVDGTRGSLVAVPGYAPAATRGGTAFGTPASGIRPDRGDYPRLDDAFVLVDDTDTPRFPPRAGTDGRLTRAEVREIVTSALEVADRARAQIRRPLGSNARVTVAVTDTNGEVLAIARGRDAPLFGVDVALQKARTATFFSSAGAASDLRSVPPAQYLANGTSSDIGGYVDRVRDFLGSSTALADGAFAFADRSGGNLSRPFFPDGIRGNPPGPLSKPFDKWSPFSTGLQLDLVNNAVLRHVTFVLGGGPDVGNNCTGIGRLANGIQIFPGSVPIYRGDQLIGGIGVSGDGVDQDDLVAFLGLHNAGEALGTVNNAPKDMRADQLDPKGVHLRFVQCPQKPFLDSEEADVCSGK